MPNYERANSTESGREPWALGSAPLLSALAASPPREELTAHVAGALRPVDIGAQNPVALVPALKESAVRGEGMTGDPGLQDRSVI